MSNSKLISYTRLTKSHSGKRNHSVDRITPHCVVGQCSIESLGALFADESYECSSNYGIGYDGKVGLFVDEANRSWCSSSSSNDNRAITIECASDAYEPYAFKAVVYNKLVDLCVDICKRYGKTKLLWISDREKALNYIPKSNEMLLTVHRWFANKSCPGDWMYNRMGNLASEVTKRLGSSSTSTKTNTNTNTKTNINTKSTSTIKKGDLVSIKDGATYYGGGAVPGWVKNQNWYVIEVSGDRAVIDKNEKGTNAICSPISTKYLSVKSSKTKTSKRTYTVKDGDTLWYIANTLLGNGSRYPEIKKLNGLSSDLIRTGQKLYIPEK